MEFYEDLGNAMDNLTKRGAFLTVKNNEGKVNTMTISWGFIGFSWNKPQFITMVRHQRNTHEILNTASSYTISIPYDNSMNTALNICGSKSGRDVNKQELAKIEYLDAQNVESPVVDGCNMYYECKINYVNKLETDKLPAHILNNYYEGDYHDIYIGEIVSCYKK